MVLHFFSSKAKRTEAARKAANAELEAQHMNLYKEGTDNLRMAFEAAQIKLDGVPIKKELDDADVALQHATDRFTKLGYIDPLDDEERTVLTKLETHSAGVKSDPDRFKATWTTEKAEQLDMLQNREQVSTRMLEVRELVKTSWQKHELKTEGDELLEQVKGKLKLGKVFGARAMIPNIISLYTRSGYTRAEGTVEKVMAPVRLLAAVKLQSLWRGFSSRSRAAAIRWNKDRFRLEASSLFMALDTDHGGTLSREELSEGLVLVGYAKEEIVSVLQHLDADGDGEITMDEFISGFRDALGAGSVVNAKPVHVEGEVGKVVEQVFWDDDEEVEEATRVTLSVGDLPMDGGGTVGRTRTGATTHLFAELHYSAKMGDVIRVWALVNRTKVPVNARTSNGTTALHLAAQGGHVAVINVLVALGAQLDARTHGGYTPIHCAAGSNRAAVLKELVRVKADVNVAQTRSGASPLHWAAREGHEDALRELVEQNANVDMPDANANTPLMYAARHAKTEAVQLLLELNASLSETNSDGRSALFHAAEKGATDAALKLMSAGASAEDLQDYGRTASDLAEFRGFAETSRVIREAESSRAEAPVLHSDFQRGKSVRKMQIHEIFEKRVQMPEGSVSSDRDAEREGRKSRRKEGIF